MTDGVEDTKSPEGWNLLKPAKDLPAWDQAELLAALMPLVNAVKAELPMNDPQSLLAIAGASRALLPHVTDEDAYTRLVTGPEGIERAVNLAAAFAAELGI